MPLEARAFLRACITRMLIRRPRGVQSGCVVCVFRRPRSAQSGCVVRVCLWLWSSAENIDPRAEGFCWLVVAVD